MANSMDFYASLTINRCHLERLCDIWARYYADDIFPFRHVIVSPLFVRNGILPRIYQHRERCTTIFDSGGFHVQQGRIRLRSACRRLRQIYRQNSWADRFALPDAPLTSLDSQQSVRKKLRSTRRQYRAFPAGFSDALRKKLLPVVHGTTPQQILCNARAARRVGSGSIGFGGFATSGPNAGVNSFTANSLRLLVQLAALASKWRLNTHVFGIGGPAAIVVLRYVPVQSFDSAGWIRTAAYGNVYLPYLGAINITGAAASRRYVPRREFTSLRKETGHFCPFCRDENLLVRSWPHRALHNYCVVVQSTLALENTEAEQAMEKLRRFNPRFAGYLELVLSQRSYPLENPTNPGNAPFD